MGRRHLEGKRRGETKKMSLRMNVGGIFALLTFFLLFLQDQKKINPPTHSPRSPAQRSITFDPMYPITSFRIASHRIDIQILAVARKKRGEIVS